MNTPKISIVTAVYNRASTLPDVLSSLQSQSYAPVEHIIQDGGSTDGTLDVIKRLKNATVSLQSAPDGGIYDAINKGIARATGDIIGLMHSDDFFANDTILQQVAAALEDPSIDGVYGDLDYVNSDDTSRIVRKWRSGAYTPDRLAKGWMPPHPTLYLRKNVFQEWGAYDTSYRIAADYDAMLRYLVKGQIKLAYVPEVFLKMRVGGESNRSLKKIIQKSREDYRAIKSNNVGGLATLAVKNFSKIKQFF
jgi:glycosyltransferase